jgi:hypothetical protein
MDNAACGTHAIVAETFTEGLTDDSGRAPCLGNHIGFVSKNKAGGIVYIP